MAELQPADSNLVPRHDRTDTAVAGQAPAPPTSRPRSQVSGSADRLPENWMDLIN